MINNFKNILMVVAHCDDMEFIAGGVLARLADTDSSISLITLASREQNTGEPHELTLKQQAGSLEVLGVQLKLLENYQYRSRFLPEYEDEVRLALSKVRNELGPDLVITHFLNDPNQDHSSVARQVLRVFNNATILGGEVSNTGQALDPNTYISISVDHIDKKYRALQMYGNESRKSYFARELIEALARVRGGHSKVADFAEAFELYKSVW